MSVHPQQLFEVHSTSDLLVVPDPSRLFAVPTGERRAPKRGEWFIHTDCPGPSFAVKAEHNFTSVRSIAKLVYVEDVVVREVH
jgi:hypothetical protein